MKNKLYHILILTFCLINISFGQETSFPKQIGFVNDFENLLSVDDITKLENLLINYEKQTSNEIVIVTISKTTNGSNFNDYALDLANNWAVGEKGKDNDVVIVISNQMRSIRICTGIGLENILTDEICDNILQENIVPNFKNEEIYKGIESGVNALIDKWK